MVEGPGGKLQPPVPLLVECMQPVRHTAYIQAFSSGLVNLRAPAFTHNSATAYTVAAPYTSCSSSTFYIYFLFQLATPLLHTSATRRSLAQRISTSSSSLQPGRLARARTQSFRVGCAFSTVLEPLMPPGFLWGTRVSP